MAGIMKTIGGLFAPKMPAITPAAGGVTQMPDPQDPAALLAARKKLEERQAKGRAGTIYTNGSGAYNQQNLGGTQ